jgi:hypothetical protein
MLRRGRVAEAEPQIRELINLLLGPQQLPVGGIASAYQLLTDGTGPLYSRINTTTLTDAVTEVVARLVPALPPTS